MLVVTRFASGKLVSTNMSLSRNDHSEFLVPDRCRTIVRWTSYRKRSFTNLAWEWMVKRNYWVLFRVLSWIVLF